MDYKAQYQKLMRKHNQIHTLIQNQKYKHVSDFWKVHHKPSQKFQRAILRQNIESVLCTI